MGSSVPRGTRIGYDLGALTRVQHTSRDDAASIGELDEPLKDGKRDQASSISSMEGNVDENKARHASN